RARRDAPVRESSVLARELPAGPVVGPMRVASAAVTASLPIAGAITVLLATRWGIGTSVDSVAYLHGASTLAAGTGEPALVQHAPLYSFLLAAGARLGVDPMAGARWLNALTFGINIFLVGFLIRRSVSDAPWLWAIGSL